jgi:tetratricopeptide (TPR) repeat protein
MQAACHRCSVCLIVLVSLLSGVSTAKADKNNKFFFSVERYSGNGVVYFHRAVRELDRGNLHGGQQALESAVRADPKMWPAWFMLAQVNMELGKYNLALQNCNEAARLKPQFKRTFVIRAQIYASLGRCSEGLADLDRVISLHANDEVDAFALDVRSRLRTNCSNTAVHDPRKALEDATLACKLDGWHMAIYLDTLAKAYAANGEFDSAIRYEKKAIGSGRFLPDELQRAEKHLASFEKHQGP